MMRNVDSKVVEGFGQEWAAFDQTSLAEAEHNELFESYFAVFPFDRLPPNAEGFDLGCGSGRWAVKMAPRVGLLHCIDPAAKALEVAQRRLANMPNVRLHLATSENIPVPDNSQDFGYSLGVLHHIPDTEAAMLDCVRKLKPGAPFLAYLYYRFDNKPFWFSAVWKATDIVRRRLARMPFSVRKLASGIIAATVYWPLARTSSTAERLGFDVKNVPLSPYRKLSFYTMRTDALDRFGTRLEQRFTRPEIVAMMTRCGLEDVRFHDGIPYWVACGIKAPAPAVAKPA